MAIYREVITEVYCDICGEKIKSWYSKRNGVSKEWAKYFAREEGCTTGKKIVCKQCRIKQRMEKCGLQKKYGTAGKDGSGACLGFSSEWDDEPIEQCKRCIACASFDWDEEKVKHRRKKTRESMRKKHKRENKALKLLIWIAAAAGVTVVALFALLTSREQQQEHKNADKRQQAEPLVIEVPEQATEGSIRVFDYDGCCIYAYYGKIEIRNDGRDGKEIDIVCAGYLEGYEEHKEPDETGEREAEHE